MNEKTSCITINCGCCGSGNGGSVSGTGDGAPIGTVIAYMGTKAPEHYLVCDGAELNIADYTALSSQIQEEFGQVDCFGGDGETTFAVPDLRNEFLRGFHGAAQEQFSGDVGKHQEGTYIKNMSSANDGGKTRKNLIVPTRDVYTYEPSFVNEDCFRTVLNSADEIVNHAYSQTHVASGVANLTETGNPNPIDFLARPTNVAVLYCIKYE